MTKEATFQVRIDADLKEEVEDLYRQLGTSFAEAVRIFARQSVTQKGFPFPVRLSAQPSLRGVAAKWANPALIPQEGVAFCRAVAKKHTENG